MIFKKYYKKEYNKDLHVDERKQIFRRLDDFNKWLIRLNDKS
jgi:hypothetical protein